MNLYALELHVNDKLAEARAASARAAAVASLGPARRGLLSRLLLAVRAGRGERAQRAVIFGLRPRASGHPGSS